MQVLCIRVGDLLLLTMTLIATGGRGDGHVNADGGDVCGVADVSCGVVCGIEGVDDD